jgi:hypothetical protein|tara:strand:+ start:1293 stop:1409 length:117 start_codon:yes stop_codon:yes gene_type:complete
MKNLKIHEDGLLSEGIGKYVIEINMMMFATLTILSLVG